MLSNFSTVRREIAAVLVGILGLAAHFVPGLAALDPLWIDTAAGALALVALALVENRIDGLPLRDLARIAADHLIRDDNVLEAIRAARVLRSDPPDPDPAAGPVPYAPGPRQAVATYPPLWSGAPPADRRIGAAPATRGG
ncbi:hypothetical protein [Amaricoccus solimangrovi]|uniref:Uncharacterized protein n=1 Tax=Amaricoccus solimangrovi TaxID=2589815 RepID=A0A501WWH4_9RHOB|nr:hypothetical protein [Amaricoccus solimangrovi]TPE52595.1 hypothetical protein FJM51_05295 [Amaricoccus solimangrovi]